MASPMIQGNLTDRAILKEEKFDIIFPQQFSGILVQTVGTVDVLSSVGAGTPAIAQISTLGLAGLQIEAAGDAVHHLMPIPKHWDLEQKIKFSVLFATTNTADSQTVTFDLLYDQIDVGGAVADAATALDTPLPVATDSVTSLGIVETDKGVIDGFTLSHGKFLSLKLAVSATTLVLSGTGATPLYILGLKVYYIPRLTGRLI